MCRIGAFAGGYNLRDPAASRCRKPSAGSVGERRKSYRRHQVWQPWPCSQQMVKICLRLVSYFGKCNSREANQKRTSYENDATYPDAAGQADISIAPQTQGAPLASLRVRGRGNGRICIQVDSPKSFCARRWGTQVS